MSDSAPPPNPAPTGPQARDLKRGEILLQSGTKSQSLFLIQSGLLAIVQPRNEKSIEICQLTAPQIVGEELLFGGTISGYNVVALRDSRVVELPIATAKPFLATLGLEGGLLAKGLFERLKTTFNELKTERSNREVTPCPGNATAKAFGVIYHSIRAVGKAESETVCAASWPELKSYAHEVFDEPLTRIDHVVEILVKLGYAQLDHADPAKARSIRITEMRQIETFFDFFGTYHFKGGHADFLKTNERSTRVTQALLEVAKSATADRSGNVQLPYKSTIDSLKALLGPSFEADQLFRLEQKGLFMKRTATQDGGLLSFYRPDYEQMLLTWKVLKQVELWNQHGWVEVSSAGPSKAVISEADIAADEQSRAEREKWARRLAGWKPFALRGKPVQLRSGKPRLGEVWCHVCMSVLPKNGETCEVCGAEVPRKKAS